MPIYALESRLIYVKNFLKLTYFAIVILCSFKVFGSHSIIFKSTPNPPFLLEMYSSQGCSSCPPAQAWINRFTDSPDLWNKIIPMVFHVDYWDYIGWKDPFSSVEHSIRQRKLKREGLVDSVYTPGFVINGHEWKGWFNGRPLASEQMDPSSVVMLSAILTPEQVAVEYLTSDPHVHIEGMVHLAILGFDLKTQIKKGENANKTLSDNFVVLGYKRQKIGVDRQFLEYPKLVARSTKYAVVIWTSKQNGFIPTQVVGGFVPENWTF